MASVLTHLSGAISVRTARALSAVDRVSAPKRGIEHPPQLIGRVLVAIPHWRPTGLASDAKSSGSVNERIDRLVRCIQSVVGLSDAGVDVAIYTNASMQTTQHLTGRSGLEVAVGSAQSLLSTRRESTRILVVPWKPGRVYRHGFGLAWAHKSLFRQALEVPEFSHMVYLEDDMIFGRTNLEYWTRGRTELSASGLLPGFVRFECSAGERWLTDLKQPMSRPEPVVTTGDGRSWVTMVNPYQALYVLDRPLAIDHFRRSASRGRIRSRIRPHDDLASASHGPIYDDPPSGLAWRTVVPTEQGVIDPAALVEHASANYADDPTTDLATVRVSEVFHE